MKNLMMGAVAAAAALAMPTAAGATVIPGATYSGTFTTGSGGTAEIVVSEDGTTVEEFHAGSFGQAGCDGISLTTVPLAITDDSFAQFIAGPPVIDIQGFFGDPGTASGTARSTTFCESGTQSWTAEAPVVWPDGVLEHATRGFAGENVYNASGEGQLIRTTARRGKKGRFSFHAHNDGTEAGSFAVKGCGSSKGFRVKFTQGGDNVTSGVKSGAYATGVLDPDDAETLRLQITVSKKAKPGKTKSCKVTASHGGLNRGGSVGASSDAVKAVLKVKRG